MLQISYDDSDRSPFLMIFRIADVCGPRQTLVSGQWGPRGPPGHGNKSPGPALRQLLQPAAAAAAYWAAAMGHAGLERMKMKNKKTNKIQKTSLLAYLQARGACHLRAARIETRCRETMPPHATLARASHLREKRPISSRFFHVSFYLYPFPLALPS